MVAGFSAELPAARLAALDHGQRRQTLATYVTTVALLSITIAAAVALAAPLIASSIWQAKDAAPLVEVSALLIAFTGVQIASWNVHRLQGRPAKYALLSSADMGLRWSNSGAVITGGGIGAVLGAYLAVAAVGAGLGIWTIRGDIALPISREVVPRLLSGGAAFTLTTAAFVVAGYVVRGLVAGAGSTTAVASWQLAFAPRACWHSLWPRFNTHGAPGHDSGTLRASKRAIQTSITGVIVLGGLACVGISALSTEIVAVIAGSEFGAAAAATPGLALATVLNTAFVVLAVASSAAQLSMWAIAIIAFCGSGLQIVATALLLGVLSEMPAASMGPPPEPLQLF